MLSRFIVAFLIASSTCSIICGAGCDPANPDAVTCAAPMDLFGPCVADQCNPGLLCFGTQDGSSCVPPVDDTDDWSWSFCAAQVGHALVCFESEGFCAASCDSDNDCVGTVCDENTKLCVHPWD